MQQATPISQYRIVEHKLGFKQVIGCACGAVLDTNVATTRERKAFRQVHDLCPPKVERDEIVTQEHVGLVQE